MIRHCRGAPILVAALLRWPPALAVMIATFVALSVECGKASDGAPANVLLVTGTLTVAIPGTSKCYDVQNTGAFGYHLEASGGSTFVDVSVPWGKSTGSFNLSPTQAHFQRDGASWAVTSGTFHIDQFDGGSAEGRLDATFDRLSSGSTKTIHVVSAWSCMLMPYVVN